MRYSEIDLQCEDVMWFGIDASGHIMAFTSGGCGSIPEFVCRSREETDRLENFFLEQLNLSSACRTAITEGGSTLAEDARNLAEKGIFVYDISFDNSHTGDYSLIAAPENPLDISALPSDIAALLNDHIIAHGEAGEKYLRVGSAY